MPFDIRNLPFQASEGREVLNICYQSPPFLGGGQVNWHSACLIVPFLPYLTFSYCMYQYVSCYYSRYSSVHTFLTEVNKPHFAEHYKEHLYVVIKLMNSQQRANLSAVVSEAAVLTGFFN